MKKNGCLQSTNIMRSGVAKEGASSNTAQPDGSNAIAYKTEKSDYTILLQ